MECRSDHSYQRRHRDRRITGSRVGLKSYAIVQGIGSDPDALLFANFVVRMIFGRSFGRQDFRSVRRRERITDIFDKMRYISYDREKRMDHQERDHSV